VVQQDNWAIGLTPSDYEIRGRFVLAYHIYPPLVVRNS
jgi:hypothetical protein